MNTPPKNKQKWAIFTYTDKETKIITILFKNTNIRTSFEATNTIRNHLKPKTLNTDILLFNDTVNTSDYGARILGLSWKRCCLGLICSTISVSAWGLSATTVSSVRIADLRADIYS
jgi:hypothetical protein